MGEKKMEEKKKTANVEKVVSPKVAEPKVASTKVANAKHKIAKTDPRGVALRNAMTKMLKKSSTFDRMIAKSDLQGCGVLQLQFFLVIAGKLVKKFTLWWNQMCSR